MIQGLLVTRGMTPTETTTQETAFQTLVQAPESLRDAGWEARFLDALVPMKVALDGDEPKPGPDGWPYMKVRTTPGASEPFSRIVAWLAGRGIGLVVNAHKMVPDYVFTYGMIWNFVETGRFVVPQTDDAAKPGAISLEQKNLIMGAPTDKYLPRYVRAILREYLTQTGIRQPRILVVTTPDFKQTDLVLSLESLMNPAQKEHRGLAEAIGWFLPLHYNLVLASEAGMPAFSPL